MRRLIFRSIRSRTIFTLACLILIMLIITALALDCVVVNNINKLEIQTVKERMSQVGIGINFELMDLKKIVVDWAEWDDAYNFVVGENPDFVTSNLAASFFSNLRLASMIYVNEKGQFVYAQQINKSGDGLEPVPKADKSEILHFVMTNEGKRVQGVLRVSSGVLLIATNPVLTSDGEGPAHGMMVIYRYLDDSEIQYISTMINQNISLEPVADEKLPSTQPGSFLSSSVDIDKSSRTAIKGSSTLYDLNGTPAGILAISMDRKLSEIGKAGTRSVEIALFFAGLVVMTVLLFLLNRIILSRVLSMSKTIQAVGERVDPSLRLSMDGYGDELTQMSAEINKMLDRVQSSQKQVQDRENELLEASEELRLEVEERKKAQEQITFLAYHDHLTELPNRLHFMEHLEHGIRLAGRAEKLLAIYFLDLDAFKMINDTMGHLAGDILLTEVSKQLKAALRDSDTVARLGGDEFVVMVENIEDVEAIEAVAKKILHIFDKPFNLKNQECFITTSIGVAVYPADGNNSEKLIKNADIAMYHAKEKGKNQYVLCSEGIKNKLYETMRISNQLFRALEHGQFEVYYQPQVSSCSNKIVGAEALIRWHHPKMGMVMPGKFIPIAEQNGTILPIGRWVLQSACSQAKKWQDAGFPRIRMGVNLSLRQFQNHNIIQEVQSVLNESGLSPNDLELEITESIAMKERDYVFSSLSTLRGMGVHISIDDFGTEYSSMNNLKQLPVDRIKIPMPFVHGIDVNRKDEAITKSIIVLAKSLGLGVIAEGVETQTQYDFLTQRMCDEIQGYYYYKPMCAKDFKTLLQGHQTL